MRSLIFRSRIVQLLISLCFISTAVGQAPTLNNMLYNKRPEISSPNAAALEKYVEFPTATHTGVPDISLPLYTIGIKGVQLPIGLSYHAGGIKVDEVSSDVGTGWTLIAGGAITILPNGIMDEVSGYPNIGAGNYDKIKNNGLQSGYGGGVIPCATALMYSDPLNSPDPYGLYSGGDISLLGGVINETHDTEPDIYSFQFPGKSGKFFVDETGVFRTIPYSEMKIERVMSGSFPAGYNIVDEMGNRFEFRTKEESIEMQANAANSMNPSQRTSRTYYLSKIENVYGEVIDFYYSSYNTTYNLQKTFNRTRTPMGTDCWQMNSSGSYFSTGWTYGTMTVIGQRLDSIRVSDGSMVVLGYSSTNRTDLTGAKALQKIELWQYLGGRKKIKEVTLNQSYSNGRLVLNSVQESGKPPTTFTYYGDLPVRLSFSQDHFGYHNGQENATLLPADEYNGFPDGANRSVNTTSAMAGILTKVNHPTGGRTEYDYESNDFYIAETTYRKQKTLGAYLFSQPNQTTTVNFTVPANAENIFLNHTNSYDGSQTHNDYSIIHLTGPNGYSKDFLGNTQPNTPFLNLVPGQYTLSIENVGTTYSAEVILDWFQDVAIPPHHELGGGLRIKEIRMYDAENRLALAKRYEYKKAGTDQSSGVISTYPVYTTFTNPTIYKQAQSGQTSCTSISCQLITQSSNCIAPIFFANGSSVMYKEVVSYIQNKQQNGYTYYKFNISDIGFNMGVIGFPYAPRIPYDWVNGSLLEQDDYAYVNNQYVLVKKAKNYYNYDEFDPAVHTTNLYTGYGVKVGIADPPSICWSVCQGSVIGTTISSIYFGLHPYKLYSSWYKLIKTEETVYSLTGALPYGTSTEYFNDNANSIQVNRIETKSSKGEILIRQLKYPKDYSSYGFVQYLLSKNMLAVPVEKYEVLKDAMNNQFVTAGEIVTFKPNSVLPDKTYSYDAGMRVAVGSFTASTMNSSGQLIMDTKYKERASFNSYNSIGGITELQKKDDVKETYLWGYSNSQPVARVIGAGYNTVSALVSQSILDNTEGIYSDAQMRAELNKIRNGLSGTLALITTYTYQPLVGMTSETDPNGRTTYYEYDALGRLMLVRDQDNNILKKICYNYTGQIEDCGVAIYNSVSKSGTFTRNNCGTNGTGSSVIYTVTAGTYTSTISQSDADQKAQNDINTNGQAYANANGTCTWTSQTQSGNFTRNNCGTNGTGSTVSYTISAGSYSSTISLADANQKALNAVNTGGQTYANANGTCTWINQAQSGNFTRNNCTDGGTGSTVTYNIAAGTYSSTISLADANQQAVNAVNTGGQAYANANATCTWYNQAQSGNFTRNNCGTNGTGGTVTYTVAANTYSSTVSLADANQKAVNAVNTGGQAYANANAGCTWYNQAMSQNFTRNNCPQYYTGETIAYNVAVNTYTSTVSLAAANQLAQNDINTNGQTYANTNANCVPSCTGATCSGESRRCVYGVCETGIKVYTSSTYQGPGSYYCVYHYEFSDGGWSENFSEYSSFNCTGGGVED
jgi:YD repeat-containing protein